MPLFIVYGGNGDLSNYYQILKRASKGIGARTGRMRSVPSDVNKKKHALKMSLYGEPEEPWSPTHMKQELEEPDSLKQEPNFDPYI